MRDPLIPSRAGGSSATRLGKASAGPARAKRRGVASVGDGETLPPDAYKRWLASRILEDPGCVVDATSHPVRGRFEIGAHRHSDLIQLDIIEGCQGEAIVDERVVPLQGTTLMMVPPGMTHGYELTVESDRAAVWLIKVRLPSNRPRCIDTSVGGSENGIPAILTGLSEKPLIKQELASFIGDWTPGGVGVVALAKLCLAICRWPTAAHEVEPELVLPTEQTEHAGLPVSDGPSARIRQAIQTLGQRLHDPPSMGELAAAAHMSERHFARRFRQDFGCTPHTYLAARRLDVARGMLRDLERPVSDIADALGFSSPAAFSRWFTRLAGQSPRNFRSDPHNH